MTNFSTFVKKVAAAKAKTISRDEIKQIEVKNTFSDIILYSKVDWGCRYTVIAYTALMRYADRHWLNEALENRHAVDHLKENILHQIVQWAYRRLFIEKEDTYLVESDFSGQEESSVIFFQFIELMISPKHDHRSVICELLHPSLPDLLLLLCAHWMGYSKEKETNCNSCDPSVERAQGARSNEGSQPIRFGYWISETTLMSANNLLNQILGLFQCESLACLLLKNSADASFLEENGKAELTNELAPVLYLDMIMDRMKPHLTRTSWSRNHVMKYVFKTILGQLRSPYVGDYLQYLLPPSLLFLDHHVPENKILGIECLLHIMRTCSKEELRWYGRADVLYEAIKQQLYTNEVELIKVTHPAILTILDITEKNVAKVSVGDKRCSNRYDEVMRMLLFSIEGESRIDLRRVMTEHLWIFIKRMGITVLKHIKQLINIITMYLEVYDGPEETCRFNILRALQQLIRVCWPRIFRFEQILLKSLMKFAYDILCETSSTPTEIANRLTNEAMNCLILLKLASNGEVESMLKTLMQTSELAICHELIDNVLKSSMPNQHVM